MPHNECMATYRFIETMTTYAEMDIEADSYEEAHEIYLANTTGEGEYSYSYETDYDSAVLADVKEIQ